MEINELYEIRNSLIKETKEAYHKKDIVKMLLLLDIGYKILKNLTIDKDLKKEILDIVLTLEERIKLNRINDDEEL
jgi:hypothetical protein